jgi:PAS domain S-box-containing protein
MVVLVVLAFVAAAGWMIDQGYHISLESAEARNIRALQALDEAAGRFFGRTEQVMIGIADNFFQARGGGRRRFEGGFDGRLPAASGIVDGGGRVVAAADDRVRALLAWAVRERPALFRPPSGPESPKLVIIPVTADGTAPRDEGEILLGWRVVGAGNDFAVVAEATDATRLRSSLAAAAAGNGSYPALLTIGGDVLFLPPGDGADAIAGAIREMLPPDRLARAFFGSERRRFESDRPKGLLAFHRLGRYPVVVVSAMTGDQALRPWRILTLAGVVIVFGLSALVGGLAVLHLRGVGRARRQLERLVRERTQKEGRAAERLLAAERLTHLGHWEHDLRGQADHWSDETCQILGMTPGETVVHVERLLSVMHPADRDVERAARVLALAGVKPYDVRVRVIHPDGTVRHVQLQAEVLRDDGGEPVKLIGTILDVTERVSFELCLRESEERYRKTFEAAQDALFLVDRESGVVIDANGAATSLYGYERSELLGMRWERMVAMGAGLTATAGPARHRRRDGTEVFVDLSVAEAELSGRAVAIVAVRDVTARVESEARLALTTELLTDAERIAHLGYWDWDRRARSHHWSEEHWRILGLDPATVRPGYRSFIALVHPEDRERVDRLPLGLAGNGQIGTMEFRIIRPDGAVRQLSTTVRVERDDAGEIVRLFAIQMDVTDRKQVEIALAESHATLLSVINATQEDVVMLIAADGTIQVANERAARSFGRTTADICGLPLQALMSAESWRYWRSRLDGVVAKGRPLRFEHSRGAIVFDAHLSPALSHTGRLVGVAVFERDVTARKQVEVNLRLLTRVIEQSPVSVVITDRNGRIAYVNPHFVAATGYTAESVYGKDPSLFKSGYTTPGDYRRLWDTITAGQVWQGEFHNRMKNGELRWESASIAPVRDDQGVITHFVAVKEDITRRKRAEIELLAAKERAEAASLSKSQFLATISHELRTPLNAILGFSEVIKDGLTNPAALARLGDYARHIHSNGTHLLGLINDLLDLAKIEAGKFELHEEFVDVEEVVFAAMEMVRSRAEAGQLRLATRLMPNLPLLRADDRALRHILINLLSNAVKFTPEGGHITVSAEIDDKGLLALAVADTGIGIAEADVAKALEPFGQIDNALSRRHDGTGLGLPLCRSLVERHDGHLEIVGAPGLGTTVTVRLPRDRIVVPGSACLPEPVL